MPKMIAITPVQGAELYKPGDSFECSADEAKALIGLGSAKLAGKAAAAEPDEPETTEPTGIVLKAKAKGASKAKGK